MKRAAFHTWVATKNPLKKSNADLTTKKYKKPDKVRHNLEIEVNTWNHENSRNPRIPEQTGENGGLNIFAGGSGGGGSPPRVWLTIYESQKILEHQWKNMEITVVSLGYVFLFSYVLMIQKNR